MHRFFVSTNIPSVVWSKICWLNVTYHSTSIVSEFKVRPEFSKTKFFERLRRRIRWNQNPWCYLFLLHVYALIRCNILRYFTNPIFFRIIYGSTSPKPYRNYYSYFLKNWWVSGLLIFFVVLKESRGLFSCNEILQVLN